MISEDNDDVYLNSNKSYNHFNFEVDMFQMNYIHCQ